MGLSADELQEKSNSVLENCDATKKHLEAIRKDAQVNFDEVRDTEELQDLQGKVAVIEQRLVGHEERLRKALELATSGRQLALYMSLTEYEGLWAEVGVVLRNLVETGGKTFEDLFDVIAGSVDESAASIS